MRFAPKIAAAMIGCLLLLAGSGLPAARAEPELPPCQPFDQSGRLLVSPAFRDDHTLFITRSIAGRHALLRSTDAGLTWGELPPYEARSVHPSLNYITDHTLYVLGVDPATARQVFWRSTDAGETWTIHAHDLQPPQFEINELVPLDADIVFATRRSSGLSTPEQGLLRTNDAGVTWTQLYFGRVYSLAVSPQFANDQTLLISPGDYKASYGVKKSTDGGQTWTPHNEGLVDYNPGTQISWIQFAPGFAGNRTVFLNLGGVLFKSTDAGDTWQDITWRANFSFDIWEQVVSPRYATDQTLWIWLPWAGCAPGPCRTPGSYRSQDGGVTWTPLPAPQELAVQGAGEYCGPDGNCGVLLFARHYAPEDGHHRLYKSYDAGETWQCLEDPTLPWDPAPAEIPEPTTWLLLAGGLVGLAGYARSRHGQR